ncbi:glycosyltransferase family 2 protein [Roseicitreum antarcticum]|uniref:Glycosyltransferase, catalytic subunit of cellulose synthase and poly-beta-1,6-N-acetylglucosamine synthase n=1 Tax=Roseicitreum antarcticum TaxID=564137 RepID=A0A1H2QRT2_9RHOB|nr:glycosyltransferase family 2 protein [Roseicitreum antarcticum]SDW09913.1 Glycosyltransferase, catalytic subunit of cellulose synthase and poly-beta-1,6-N-acetylglucosamine synthase [Roseicitreum antarcticum]
MGSSRAVHQVAQGGTSAAPGVLPNAPRHRLGQLLLDMGVLRPGDLLRALVLQSRQDAMLGDVLLAHGMITDAQLTEALARQFDVAVVNPLADLADPRLIDRLGPTRCLAMGCLPWRRAGAVTVIACTRPDQFALNRDALTAVFGPVAMVLIAGPHLHTALLQTRRSALRLLAENCVAPSESCRNWQASKARAWGLGVAALAVTTLIYSPLLVFSILVVVAMVTLVLSMGLKVAALVAHLRAARHAAPRSMMRAAVAGGSAHLPVISIMVPLHREEDVIPRLLARLSKLSYPVELLDVLLVVEERDATTHHALAGQTLPRWARIITVPHATLKTKPRALNFALAFAKGSIIGVYDAEDAPEADQLYLVARRFAAADPTLACLQGMLDFYNPATNWLSRCFTIEYAAWFRVILPGLERLGLVLPLGGTTLFFRRDILDKLGGWDAHNVTEDADLGIRLARHGYRTELLASTTFEEANCHVIPWIKQRSRWLKGYAITYAVHMRDPKRLLAQLGWWRFGGLQVLLLGTLVQFVLTPVLWSFWLLLFGLGHPFDGILPFPLAFGLAALFLLSETANLTVNLVALRQRHHRALRIWALSLHFYFPLAALAAYKGLWELMSSPFYWDKTTHGKYAAVTEGAPSDAAAPIDTA